MTDADGHAPTFIGIRAKYVPSTAIAVGKDALTVLSPGQSVDVEHDLSRAYNFTLTGAGVYTFKARNLFYIVGANNKAVLLYANMADVHITRLSGKLAVSRPAISRRATYVGCDASQQSDLVGAASQAQSYAADAFSYASSQSSSTPRYDTWFGTFTTTRHDTIVTHYSQLNGNDYSSYTYDCTCTDPGTYAFVDPNNFGYVTLCGAFWSAPTSGTDSKGGTLIHESTHFTANAGTQDYAYGQSACQQLALSNPDQAIMNADSHEYFAENNPALS